MAQQIAFSSTPFGGAKSEDFGQIGTLLGNGSVQWEPTVNGNVQSNPQTMLSVQPDGSFQTRPLGSPGPFETFTFDGSALTIRPNSGGFGGPQIGYVIAAKVIL